jgi:phage terminase large subunit-like protein
MAKPARALSLAEMMNEVTGALRRTSIRPTIHGYKPQPHQINFHSSLSRGRLFIGGNRSGKTVGGAAEAVMWLTGKHQFHQKFRTPVRGRAVGVDFDNGVNKIMMPEIARWLPPSELIKNSWEESYSKGDKTLTLENGSTMEFMSYDQDVDKFAGTSRHFMWFDEEPPEEIFNECLARLIDTAGNWWLTMTPLIDMSWTLDRLYTPGMTVNSSEIEILTMGMTEEQKAARLKGKYMTYSGTIYGPVLDQLVYIDPITESDHWGTYYDKWGHFGMLDHGYTNPTAFLLAAFDEEGRIVVYDEYYERARIVRENALGIHSMITGHKLKEKMEYIVADPSIRNTDPINRSSIQHEYAENGLYFSLANNDVSAGINRVTSRFKNRQLFITRNCTNLIWELNRYRWDKFQTSKAANKNNKKETPLKKDDHAVDALRYGVVSRPALPGELDMRVGNIFNSPVALTGEDRFDEELISHWGNSETSSYSHPLLGDDY